MEGGALEGEKKAADPPPPRSPTLSRRTSGNWEKSSMRGEKLFVFLISTLGSCEIQVFDFDVFPYLSFHAKLWLLAFPSANALLIGRDSIEELDSPRAVLNLLFFHDLSVYFALRLDPLSSEKSLVWKVGIWSTPYDW